MPAAGGAGSQPPAAFSFLTKQPLQGHGCPCATNSRHLPQAQLLGGFHRFVLKRTLKKGGLGKNRV